ncbi:MAG TPA: ankyrin repeat domain-containing protein [Terriglobales bacterium]|nr:ankyrin repeat domain-containing protein [Terriglobales bacterium]
MAILDEITNGRTELAFEYLAAGNPANSRDGDGVSLLQWCAYYGDVSAMKHLLANGAAIESLGENLGLDAASFHGHWQLCKFLIERGADVNRIDKDTGESPLHATLCTSERMRRNLVMKVLLAHGANPNCFTKPNVETGGFMRDCRTKGETPLHRAAAFGDKEAIQLLLDAGAKIDAKDMNGDSPLSWASWYARPTAILRKLLYGNHRIHPKNRPMDANLAGNPLPPELA